MGLADIQERQNEERKREKRLVHLANALSRDFQNSDAVKPKNAAYKQTVDYVVKSLLDYVFFEEEKEIRELHEKDLQDFMLEYAPRKLNITLDMAQDMTDVLARFCMFMESEGHINNGLQLSNTVKESSRQFLKLIKARKPIKETKPSKTEKAKKVETEVTVGRNDPCPCGSGKKYKKCCGRTQ